MDISVVIPLYNEEESLPELTDWIKRVMDENGFSYEILMVDDGSRDNSWAVVEDIHSKNPHAKGIKFSTNYGKSAALHVGFQAAKGDVVITMDADLQDSPDEIPDLYKLIMVDGYDLISGWKKKRYDPLSKTIPTKLFNAVTRWSSGINNLHDFNCGLKSYRRDVVKAIEIYGEMHRYIPVIAKAAGFSKIGEKVVQHRARKYGTTKFGMNRFVNGMLDLMTITVITRYMKRPMHFFGFWGLIFIMIGGVALSIMMVLKLLGMTPIMNPISLSNHIPAFFFGTVSFLLGILLFTTGLLGELISRNSPIRNDYSIAKRLEGGETPLSTEKVGTQ